MQKDRGRTWTPHLRFGSLAAHPDRGREIDRKLRRSVQARARGLARALSSGVQRSNQLLDTLGHSSENAPEDAESAG